MVFPNSIKNSIKFLPKARGTNEVWFLIGPGGRSHVVEGLLISSVEPNADPVSTETCASASFLGLIKSPGPPQWTNKPPLHCDLDRTRDVKPLRRRLSSPVTRRFLVTSMETESFTNHLSFAFLSNTQKNMSAHATIPLHNCQTAARMCQVEASAQNLKFLSKWFILHSYVHLFTRSLAILSTDVHRCAWFVSTF